MFIAAIAVSSLSFSQEIKRNPEIKIVDGKVDLSEVNKSYGKYYLSYKNAEYKYHIDIASITFDTDEELSKFSSLLGQLINEAKGAEVDSKEWSMYKAESSVMLFNDDQKYIFLYKDDVSKFVDSVTDYLSKI